MNVERLVEFLLRCVAIAIWVYASEKGGVITGLLVGLVMVWLFRSNTGRDMMGLPPNSEPEPEPEPESEPPNPNNVGDPTFGLLGRFWGAPEQPAYPHKSIEAEAEPELMPEEPVPDFTTDSEPMSSGHLYVLPPPPGRKSDA